MVPFGGLFIELGLMTLAPEMVPPPEVLPPPPPPPHAATTSAQASNPPSPTRLFMRSPPEDVRRVETVQSAPSHLTLPLPVGVVKEPRVNGAPARLTDCSPARGGPVARSPAGPIEPGVCQPDRVVATAHRVLLVAAAAVTIALSATGCGGGATTSTRATPATTATTTASASAGARAPGPRRARARAADRRHRPFAPLRTGRIPPLLRRGDVYAAGRPGRLSRRARRARALVYVPNSASDTVDVISQRTGRVIRRFAVGAEPQHVTPSWDLRTLWVTSDRGNSLTPIDPRTGRPGRAPPAPGPPLHPLLHRRRAAGDRGRRGLPAARLPPAALDAPRARPARADLRGRRPHGLHGRRPPGARVGRVLRAHDRRRPAPRARRQDDRVAPGRDAPGRQAGARRANVLRRRHGRGRRVADLRAAHAQAAVRADRARRARPLPEPRRTPALCHQPRRGLDHAHLLPPPATGRQVAHPRRRIARHGRRVGRRACALVVGPLRRRGLRHQHAHREAAAPRPGRQRAARALCLAPARAVLDRAHRDPALMRRRRPQRRAEARPPARRRRWIRRCARIAGGGTRRGVTRPPRVG